MKKDIRIYTHQRGNHTAYHIRHYGKLYFKGTAKECKEELKRMRERSKQCFYSANTNLSMREYIKDDFADVFVLDCTDNPNEPKFFHW